MIWDWNENVNVMRNEAIFSYEAKKIVKRIVERVRTVPWAFRLVGL